MQSGNGKNDAEGCGDRRKSCLHGDSAAINPGIQYSGEPRFKAERLRHCQCRQPGRSLLLQGTSDLEKMCRIVVTFKTEIEHGIIASAFAFEVESIASNPEE